MPFLDTLQDYERISQGLALQDLEQVFMAEDVFGIRDLRDRIEQATQGEKIAIFGPHDEIPWQSRAHMVPPELHVDRGDLVLEASRTRLGEPVILINIDQRSRVGMVLAEAMA
jgi:hypothetical protein